MDPTRQRRILRQHLRTEALLGVDGVPCREGATPTLVASLPQANPSTSKPRISPRIMPPPASRPPQTPVVPTSGNGHLDIAPLSAAPLDSAEKLRVLTAMDRDEVQVCTRCDLCRSRQRTVFGEGDHDAQIMFIGEGPGQNEDEQGRPFVGRAGELLEKMIIAMGLSRERVYIANVVKCRPPNNRTPTPAEVAACWGYLQRQVLTIRPKVIVTLGGPAAKALLGTREGITRIRGVWHAYEGVQPTIPVMPTFHPAYLLRAYTRENRARVWSDLQAVLARVGGEEVSSS